MLNAAKHRSILLDILKDIYDDTSIHSILGFKGGTALYFFYDLNRFSVDLDFDLLDLDAAEQVYDTLSRILVKHGELKSSLNKRNSIQFLLSYDSCSQNIKVDIFKRNFGSSYEIQYALGLSMNVMKIEDMFAHKLIALTDRAKPAVRDMYDLYFMFNQRLDFNQDIIKLRSGLTAIDYLAKAIELVEQVKLTNILSDIGDLLDEKQKNWVKTKLLSELLFKLRLELEVRTRR
ncbi:MAG: nucleotidyl transferase AbiEii/AbiGii toxin family protein [Candidatus Melainabacteria bacterium]|nr:nucleotidyl transferase AbiEii/AbiGii toxin family protein [Candidatus Melainabacteria bacterium]